MKKLLYFLIFSLFIVSCGDPVQPNNTDIYGIWEGTEVLEKANPDSTYLYCEFSGTNEAISGQAIFQANRFVYQNKDYTNIRYFRSGSIVGNFISPNVSFTFKNDNNTLYEFKGEINSEKTEIFGIMSIHDKKYSGTKDTTFLCNITIKQKKI